jgi:hypothetical protein
MGAGGSKLGSLIGQAVLVGAALFVISLLVRGVANTIVGAPTRGPAPPPPDAGTWAVFASWVLLPALIETPFVVYLVRRTNRERVSLALWIMLAIIFGGAWLLHGASPGTLGQACAFMLMAYMSWDWSRQSGRLAYGLAILSHAVWNGIGMAIHLAKHPPQAPG